MDNIFSFEKPFLSLRSILALFNWIKMRCTLLSILKFKKKGAKRVSTVGSTGKQKGFKHILLTVKSRFNWIHLSRVVRLGYGVTF